MMKSNPLKFPGKRVLLVEDYALNQEIVQDMLELMECQVDTAENGKQALELQEKNVYDVILMDVQMPEMDGYTTTQEIRKREAGKKHSAILALTANALVGDREKCLEAGMDDYLAKPVDLDKLENVLKKYLGS
jgi:CheY-like chemotaxis protein